MLHKFAQSSSQSCHSLDYRLKEYKHCILLLSCPTFFVSSYSSGFLPLQLLHVHPILIEVSIAVLNVWFVYSMLYMYNYACVQLVLHQHTISFCKFNQLFN